MKKFVSWNVNGLRAVVQKNFYEAFSSLDASIGGSLDPGLFYVRGYLQDGVSYEEGNAVIQKELEAFLKEGATEYEITKYVNKQEKDKIKIIIEELSTSPIYETNLMSYLNANVSLVDYTLENDVLYLNFNKIFKNI